MIVSLSTRTLFCIFWHTPSTSFLSFIIFATCSANLCIPPPKQPIIIGKIFTSYPGLFSLVVNVSCWYSLSFSLCLSLILCSCGQAISTIQISFFLPCLRVSSPVSSLSQLPSACIQNPTASYYYYYYYFCCYYYYYYYYYYCLVKLTAWASCSCTE